MWCLRFALKESSKMNNNKRRVIKWGNKRLVWYSQMSNLVHGYLGLLDSFLGLRYLKISIINYLFKGKDFNG